MCGDGPHRGSFGGAVAVMAPTERSVTMFPCPLRGRLFFECLEGGSSVATHASYAPDSPLAVDMLKVYGDSCLVKIHETGDLTKPAAESPVWATLSLTMACVENLMMYELDRPVKTEVGDDGIIGRRISIWWRGEDKEPISEGIAGFN